MHEHISQMLLVGEEIVRTPLENIYFSIPTGAPTIPSISTIIMHLNKMTAYMKTHLYH